MSQIKSSTFLDRKISMSKMNFILEKFQIPELVGPLLNYFGRNLCELVRVKRAIDPDMHFDFPQGIPLDAPPGSCPDLPPLADANSRSDSDSTFSVALIAAFCLELPSGL